VCACGILGGSGGLGAAWAAVAASRGAVTTFLSDFFVDRFGGGWHKQIKAGSNYHANNQ